MNLLFSGEQSGILGCRTTGHRTAGIDQLSVQCNNAESVGVTPCDLYRSVNIPCHSNSTQKILGNILITAVKSDQINRSGNKAVHLFDSVSV